MQSAMLLQRLLLRRLPTKRSDISPLTGTAHPLSSDADSLSSSICLPVLDDPAPGQSSLHTVNPRGATWDVGRSRPSLHSASLASFHQPAACFSSHAQRTRATAAEGASPPEAHPGTPLPPDTSAWHSWPEREAAATPAHWQGYPATASAAQAPALPPAATGDSAAQLQQAVPSRARSSKLNEVWDSAVGVSAGAAEPLTAAPHSAAARPSSGGPDEDQSLLPSQHHQHQPPSASPSACQPGEAPPADAPHSHTIDARREARQRDAPSLQGEAPAFPGLDPVAPRQPLPPKPEPREKPARTAAQLLGLPPPASLPAKPTLLAPPPPRDAHAPRVQLSALLGHQVPPPSLRPATAPASRAPPAPHVSPAPPPRLAGQQQGPSAPSSTSADLAMLLSQHPAPSVVASASALPTPQGPFVAAADPAAAPASPPLPSGSKHVGDAPAPVLPPGQLHGDGVQRASAGDAPPQAASSSSSSFATRVWGLLAAAVELVRRPETLVPALNHYLASLRGDPPPEPPTPGGDWGFIPPPWYDAHAVRAASGAAAPSPTAASPAAAPAAAAAAAAAAGGSPLSAATSSEQHLAAPLVSALTSLHPASSQQQQQQQPQLPPPPPSFPQPKARPRVRTGTALVPSSPKSGGALTIGEMRIDPRAARRPAAAAPRPLLTPAEAAAAAAERATDRETILVLRREKQELEAALAGSSSARSLGASPSEALPELPAASGLGAAASPASPTGQAGRTIVPPAGAAKSFRQLRKQLPQQLAALDLQRQEQDRLKAEADRKSQAAKKRQQEEERRLAQGGGGDGMQPHLSFWQRIGDFTSKPFTVDEFDAHFQRGPLKRPARGLPTVPGPAGGLSAPSVGASWLQKAVPTVTPLHRVPKAAPAASVGVDTRSATHVEAASADELEPAMDGGPRDEMVSIPDDVTIRALAALLGTRPAQVEQLLEAQLGVVVASDLDLVSFELAELVAMELGQVAVRQQAGHADAVGGTVAAGREAVTRPPVVTVMGHVDHGKTSLLDALRQTTVAAGEAGGITQHVGAFEVLMPDSGASITFMDTPGHAAFSEMRARGAASTDIVILAVAADDGVMPQTKEALAHARAAGVPVVIVLTKCDLPGARPNVVKGQLAAEGVELEEYGGQVQLVHTSAKSGLGLRELEEALLLLAEIMELRAPREGPASAAIIESRLVVGQGPSATVIVARGALRRGDAVLVGTHHGVVRGLFSGAGEPIAEARPGQVAQIFGLSGLPNAGDELRSVASEARARLIAEARASRGEDLRRLRLAASLHEVRRREAEMHGAAHARRRALKADLIALLMERKKTAAAKLAEAASKFRETQASLGAVVDLQAREAAEAAAAAAAAAEAAAARLDSASPQVEAGTAASAALPVEAKVVPLRIVPLVVKADVQGSIGAVLGMIAGLESDTVQLRVIYSGVGPLTPSDVNLASASGAAIVAFNLPGGGTGSSSPEVDGLVSEAHVRVISHNVVYHLINQIQAFVDDGGVETARVEQVVGSATVMTMFALSGKKGGNIAGARVNTGQLLRGASFYRVVRAGAVIWQGPCSSLKRSKLNVDTVGSGQDCGVVLADGGFSSFETGDVLQCVQMVVEAPKRGGATALKA